MDLLIRIQLTTQQRSTLERAARAAGRTLRGFLNDTIQNVATTSRDEPIHDKFERASLDHAKRDHEAFKADRPVIWGDEEEEIAKLAGLRSRR